MNHANKLSAVTALLASAVLAPLVTAQNLRFAVASADIVVVGTDVGVRPIGKELIVHRIRVERTLRGSAPAIVSVVEHKNLSLHQRPTPAQQRVYCLHAIPEATMDRMPVPASMRPLWKMSGERGSNPTLVGGLPSEPRLTDAAEQSAKTQAKQSPAQKLLEFIDVVVAAETGTSARKLAPRLCRLALDGDPAVGAVRLEATRLLAERSTLQANLTAIDRSQLQARAVGESIDIPLKIALAELCATCEIDGLVGALILGIEQIQDPRWPRAIGRVAKHLHGDQSAAVLRQHIAASKSPKARGALLIALGATSTEGALDTLLTWRKRNGAGKFVDAALQLHGSRRALDALREPEARKTPNGAGQRDKKR